MRVCLITLMLLFKVSHSLPTQMEVSPTLKVRTPTRTYSRVVESPKMQSAKRKLQFSPNIEVNKSSPAKRIAAFPTPTKAETHDLTPRKKVLKRKLQPKTKMLAVLRESNRRLKRKLSFLSESIVVQNLLLNINPTARPFIQMNIVTRKQRKWSECEKNIALNLFHKSTSSYRYLRNNLKLTLPAISTIRGWIGVTNLDTGFCHKIFLQNLKLKVEVMSEREKQCVLLMDEMSVKKRIFLF